ncbi:7-deoxyloganetin glucosyltransferase-like protein [Cinnamomum micranthum f. kanehirae]|uniref:7-deoxyloganetin glucosyltransferase-like protein n=1 Tax=Cinnamomum micranthum f. kanehirae TaxID=337451 RepID=A0A443PGL6_9MAGN|nr:7-deoxyloganetin glucosyltransferase-like protein [Cinnamomum micranthum f. kanehirae]
MGWSRVLFQGQGNTKPMLKPGNLLYCGGFYITFIHTQLDNLGLLGSRGPDDVNGFDYLQFETIPDGLLPAFDQNGTQDISVLCGFIRRPIPCLGPFQPVQIKLDGASNVARVTCVVWSFPTLAAEELGAPGLVFLVMSASISFGSLNFCKLVERGFIPLKDPSCYNDGSLNTQILILQRYIAMEIEMHVERELLDRDEGKRQEKGKNDAANMEVASY